MNETGKINITRSETGSGYDFTFEWVGGDIIGISNELLLDGHPEIISVTGDFVTVGPYRLKIVEKKATYVLAQKVDTTDTILGFPVFVASHAGMV